MTIFRFTGVLFVAGSFVLSSNAFAGPHEISVIESHAACKDPATVVKFEEFEKYLLGVILVDIF